MSWQESSLLIFGDDMHNKKLLELYRQNTVLKCSECGGWVYLANSYTCKVCLEQLSWAFCKEK